MTNVPKIALGATAAAATLLAARRIANAPPDPDVAARAEAAAYAGPWTHGYKTVNGVKLHYAEMGNPGDPLAILLHGFPQCWYAWHNVMPHLSERFHVVAPDMRGYNWSDKPPGVSSYTPDKLAADVAALIESFGHRRAHIVGHDWGGAVAWRFGMTHSDYVDKLVVINAPHPAAFERELLHGDQLLRSYYIFLFQLPLLPEALMRLTLRASLRSSAPTPATFPDNALDVYQNAISQPHALTSMINYYRATVRHFLSLRKQVRTITSPALLIWGMKDFALSPSLTEGLEEWVSDLRIERIEDCGHWVPEEKPGLVVESLLEFL